jgi:CheY-like chemotaxis protein
MRGHDDKPSILVVEDHAALLRLIVRLLHRGGFATLAAGRAVDGLSMVRQRHGQVDLAIVDIVMPGMSGLDLATDLDREYPDLTILYISGYADSVAADVLYRQSPDRVLLKPFTEEALLERVHLLLETPSRRAPARSDESSVPQIPHGKLG